MEKYDVVYILKDGIKEYELRYSLRSIEKNLPHGDVWFVGGQPVCLFPDKALPHIQTGVLKWERARSSLIRACKCPDISEKFWLFNDDFFVLKPVESEEPFFTGMLHDHILHIEHRYNDKRTGDPSALRYCEETLHDADMTTFDYALHVPMLIDKKKMLEALRTFPDCPMFRSIYGNYAEIGGIQHDDVKIVSTNTPIPDGADFVSTSDASFFTGRVGQDLRNMFPEKSKYEDYRHRTF